MAIRTRLTTRFELEWPIVSAPMAYAAGGRLAAEVSLGGGLGLIGGGYGEHNFNERAFEDAGNTVVGIGFITWSLAKQPELLDAALAHAPKAVMLSFGDPAEFSQKIKAAGAALFCQCQTISHVHQAINAGADVIIAQGAEAGGHGGKRGTLSFVRETAGALATESPETLLLGAGGIGDGRGIAACLMLGADGVLVGSRYWASREAQVAQAFQRAAVDATGDDTIQTKIPDVARALDWPEEFEIRVLENRLTREFHPHLGNLGEGERAQIVERYIKAGEQENADDGGIIVGEVAGLIDDLPPARELTRRMGEEAQAALDAAGGFVV